MKGVILAGGKGSRLRPLTYSSSKQLLPVYDKPMIFYPLSVLMQAGINDIAIITTKNDQAAFKNLLGDGSYLGLKITYISQLEPNGLAEAPILCQEFLGREPFVLILGDNFVFGDDLKSKLNISDNFTGARTFGYRVSDPENYGIATLEHGKVVRITEKPVNPSSNLAIIGMYVFDNTAVERSKTISKSERGELEITDLLNLYLSDAQLDFTELGRGYVWFDTGSFDALLEAANFVRTIQLRQGFQIANLEEIAFRNGWIDIENLRELASYHNNSYGRYIKYVLDSQDVE